MQNAVLAAELEFNQNGGTRDQRTPSIAMAAVCFERIVLSRVLDRRRRRFAPLTKQSFRNFCWPLRSTACREGLERFNKSAAAGSPSARAAPAKRVPASAP